MITEIIPLPFSKKKKKKQLPPVHSLYNNKRHSCLTTTTPSNKFRISAHHSPQHQLHHSIQEIQYSITKADASVPFQTNQWTHNSITGPGKGSLIYRVATPVDMIGTLPPIIPHDPMRWCQSCMFWIVGRSGVSLNYYYYLRVHWSMCGTYVIWLRL